MLINSCNACSTYTLLHICICRYIDERTNHYSGTHFPCGYKPSTDVHNPVSIHRLPRGDIYGDLRHGRIVIPIGIKLHRA